MKSKKKIVTLLACAVLLVVGSVMGTMAYLTSQDDVVNTFTVGKVAITMDETDVDVNGVKDTDTRVKANEYKLMPGHTYIKDPTVTVDATSEDCWLFVKVTNDIAGIEAATNEAEGTKTIADQMADKGWSKVDRTTNIYAYNTKVKANDKVVVFDYFKIADKANTAAYVDEQGNVTAKITVVAYAIQADGFTAAGDAWAAAIAAGDITIQ